MMGGPDLRQCNLSAVTTALHRCCSYRRITYVLLPVHDPGLVKVLAPLPNAATAAELPMLKSWPW
jgi:hypothetical protein